LKYLEVHYDPYKKKVSGDFKWIAEDEEFYLVNEKVEDQKLLPNLKNLEISNQEKTPNLKDFIDEHQGFIDEIKRLDLNENEIVEHGEFTNLFIGDVEPDDLDKKIDEFIDKIENQYGTQQGVKMH